MNTQTPDPVRAGGAHELWPQLIENAYAQQQGGVVNIAKGGSPSAAMQSLTGHAAKDMDVSNYGSKRLPKV